MSTVTEAPATHVKSQTVTDRPGMRVVRLELPPGESLPSHTAPRDVLMVIVEGSGRVTLDDKILDVMPGDVVDLAVGQRHGVEAVERMTLVLVQAVLDTTQDAQRSADGVPLVPLLLGSLNLGGPRAVPAARQPARPTQKIRAPKGATAGNGKV
ncbi:MAG: cupin domain-containing protein [Deltaproteobacteria bacterium]|nr:cupin domain-containing protein [Deltaproteobacteria bacterium]